MAEDEFIDTEITDWAAHHLSVGQAKLDGGPSMGGAEMIQAHFLGVQAEFLGSIAVSLYQIGATLAATEQRAAEEADAQYDNRHPENSLDNLKALVDAATMAQPGTFGKPTISREDMTETPMSTRDWHRRVMENLSTVDDVPTAKVTIKDIQDAAGPESFGKPTAEQVRSWMDEVSSSVTVPVSKDTLANLMAFADPAARQRLADALAEEPEDVDYVRDLVSEWHSELTPDQYLRSIPGSSGLGRSEGYVSREMQPIFCDWVLDRIIHADEEPVDEDNEPEDPDEEPFPGEDSEPLDGWSNGHPV